MSNKSNSKIFDSIKVSNEVRKEVDKIFDESFYCHSFQQLQERDEPCSIQCKRCEFVSKNKY